MTEIKANTWYLYRTIFGNIYHVYVLKVGTTRSLCRWAVNSDFMGKYEKAGFKYNSQMMEDVL